MKAIREHDRVVLTTDVPQAKLAAGDVGTVVHVYDRGQAFEVEFVTLNGETCALTTLERRQVRPAHERELSHARQMA